jgi:uncharacterized protein YjbJ (UPF0337 family)
MHAHADVVPQLSVEHVRRPGTEPLALPDDGSDAEEYPAGLGQVTGQVTELVGIVTDDDTLIAEGKTAQAEAVEEATDAEQLPDPSAEDAVDPPPGDEGDDETDRSTVDAKPGPGGDQRADVS